MKTTAAVLREVGGPLLERYDLGLLELDELITREYSLEQVDTGYQDMRDGRDIRGPIRFDEGVAP